MQKLIRPCMQKRSHLYLLDHKMLLLALKAFSLHLLPQQCAANVNLGPSYWVSGGGRDGRSSYCSIAWSVVLTTHSGHLLT